jgi:WD40 repeat protein
MAFDSTRRLLATGHGDGTTSLWCLSDPTGPTCSATIPPAHRRSGSVNAVAFHPTGRLLATGYENGVAVVWDLNDPTRPIRLWTVLRRWGWRPEVFTMAFSPDQAILAIGGYRGGRRPAILWDLTGTRPARIAALRLPVVGGVMVDSRPSVFGLAFSPDARFVVIGAGQRHQVVSQYGAGPVHHDSMVILWDLANPRRPRVTATLTQRGGVRNQPGAIRRKPAATTFTGHTTTARSVAFSPDGRLLATGSDDGTVILWDLTDPSQPRPTITLVPRGRVRALAFSPDGRLLATGSSTTVELWTLL